MKNAEICDFHGFKIPVYRYNTIILGSGAAGYNAADSLLSLGARDVAMVTENVMSGTSRNAGSDKQTYYKLTLSGSEPDSAAQMAGTLYGGGCVDGDKALCEANLSAECFLKLAALGVPFPKDRHGGWVGYKTDHDPKRRATSAGPYTSRLMTERLQESALSKGLETYDRMYVIRLLTDADKSKIVGALCLDVSDERPAASALTVFCCKNIIMATGGPAGIYGDTVYPESQRGANGLAFEAGARGANLTEWQFGLASRSPRWNVSGTYMQALPRFISTTPDGGDRREFLPDYFATVSEVLSKVFLKGYQWPFDARKAMDGSSVVDLCVLSETLKGRRVWLDYRSNPFGRDVDFAALDREAAAYLESAGACFGTPYERLCHMNRPAVDFFCEHGVDLACEPLEIAMCAQHNNGGIAVDHRWRTAVEGLFAVGEAAATHGVYRPGGSALNAGQAGALRAAQHIAARRRGEPEATDIFIDIVAVQIKEMLTFVSNDARADSISARVRREIDSARTEMGNAAGVIRNVADMKRVLRDVQKKISAFPGSIKAGGVNGLRQICMLRELLISQSVYLSAYIDYIEKGGKSRGGALYADFKGETPRISLPASFAFTLDDGGFDGLIQETRYVGGGICEFSWRETIPIPKEDDFFENVWRDYRAGKHADD